MSRWHHGNPHAAYETEFQSQPPPPVHTTTAATDDSSASTPLERPPELVPHGPSPPFHSFVWILEALRDAKGMDKKRDRLRRYFKMWRERVGLDLYPIIRMLLPERDRERAVYGLKEQALAKCYTSAMGLHAKDTEGGRRLTAWKQPTGNAQQVSGDFASVLYEVINERSTVTESILSVEEVHDLLDQLSKNSQADARTAIISQFYHKLEAKDQRWLVRIILKDLKITVKEKSILDIFHPDAQKLFDVCSDLKRVCYVLYDPEKRLGDDNEAKITLNRPLLPMLSARGTGDFVAAVKSMGGKFMIEEKLDGERINIHKRGDVYQYLSRKGKDYTYLYGKDKVSGTLTPFIVSCFKEDLADCILDGEMLAFDPSEGRCLPFGSLKTAALDQTAGPNDPRPCFMVFDILYVRLHGQDGIVLANMPLFRRKNFLEGGYVNPATQKTIVGAVREIPGRMEFPFRKEGASTPSEIRIELDAVMERKGEGVILKKHDSPYVPNSRESLWMKIKPDYFDELGETCDLAVLGGYYGTSHRGGRVSSLLCGLRVDDQVDEKGVPKFTTFVKVGGGFNLADLEWMQKWHGEHWIPFDRSKPASWPSWILFSQQGIEDKPDVWIHPDNTFIVSVKGAEVVVSESFGFKRTLRFPRAKSIRFDLMTREKMIYAGSYNIELENPSYLTVNEWHAYHKQQNKKRTGEDPRMSGKKKAGGPAVKKSRLPVSFQGVNVANVVVKTQIFASTIFVILTSGTGLPDQKALQQLVVEHGGDFRVSLKTIKDGLREDDAVMIIVKSNKVAKCVPYNSQPYDQVSPHWIMDSIKAGRALPLFKKYVVRPTQETEEDPAYEADPETYHSDDSEGSDTEDEDEKPDDKDAVKIEDLDLAIRKREIEEGEKTFKVNDWLEAGGDEGLSQAYERENADDVMIERDWNEFDSGWEGGETELDEPLERMTLGEPPTPSLGDDGDQTMYDEEKFFKPMVLYFDLPEHAKTNGLEELENRWPAKRLRLLEPEVIAKGGTITTSLDDPKLSHVVMITNDQARFARIMQLTRGPRLRQIVSLGWIEESLDEATALAESDFRP